MAINDEIQYFSSSHYEKAAVDEQRLARQINKFIDENIRGLSWASVAVIAIIVTYLSMNFQIVNSASPEELRAAMAQYGTQQVEVSAFIDSPEEPQSKIRRSILGTNLEAKVVLSGHQYETQLTVGQKILVKIAGGVVAAQISDIILEQNPTSSDLEPVLVNVHLIGPDGNIVTEQTAEHGTQPALAVVRIDEIVDVVQ